MNLKELEEYLKQMREAGANDETKIEFTYFYDGVKTLNFSDMYLLSCDSSDVYMEIGFN